MNCFTHKDSWGCFPSVGRAHRKSPSPPRGHQGPGTQSGGALDRGCPFSPVYVCVPVLVVRKCRGQARSAGLSFPVPHKMELFATVLGARYMASTAPSFLGSLCTGLGVQNPVGTLLAVSAQRTLPGSPHCHCLAYRKQKSDPKAFISDPSMLLLQWLTAATHSGRQACLGTAGLGSTHM